MLRRDFFRLASCWKGHDHIRGKSKPVTKHTKSILGSRGKFRKWSVNHGLRDTRANGVEDHKASGGVRSGGGLFGARMPKSAVELRARTMEELEAAALYVPDITNRLRGKPESNPLLHQLLAPIPVSHRIAFYLNRAGDDRQSRLPRSVVVEQLRQAIASTAATGAASRVTEASFVGARATITLRWDAGVLQQPDVLRAVLQYVTQRSLEVAGTVDTGAEGYVNAKGALQSTWLALSGNNTAVQAFKNPEVVSMVDGGVLQLIDSVLGQEAMIFVTQPLHGCGGAKTCGVKEAVKWWWRKNDPSRPVCDAMSHLPTTAHKVSSFLCVPVVQLQPDLLSALQRRSVEEVEEPTSQALQSIDDYCGRRVASARVGLQVAAPLPEKEEASHHAVA